MAGGVDHSELVDELNTMNIASADAVANKLMGTFDTNRDGTLQKHEFDKFKQVEGKIDSTNTLNKVSVQDSKVSGTAPVSTKPSTKNHQPKKTSRTHIKNAWQSNDGMMMLNSNASKTDGSITEQYNRLNANMSGGICKKELATAISYANGKNSVQVAQNMMNRYDTNKDGKLTINEFKSIRRGPVPWTTENQKYGSWYEIPRATLEEIATMKR